MLGTTFRDRRSGNQGTRVRLADGREASLLWNPDRRHCLAAHGDGETTVEVAFFRGRRLLHEPVEGWHGEVCGKEPTGVFSWVPIAQARAYVEAHGGVWPETSKPTPPPPGGEAA